MRDHTKRLGKIMPFTSADGVTHDASFWCLNYQATDIGGRNGRVEFIGYHSTAAYDNDADPIAGASHSYQFAGDLFDATAYEPTRYPTGTPLAAEIIAAAWQIALATKDVGDAPVEGQPDTRAPFFANAVDV
jgi:hypothetical protein